MWKLLGGGYLGWSLGANDSANIFGTGVTTGIISYRRAILLTAIFVILGAWLQGPECMDTVSDMASITLTEAFACTAAAALTMTLLTIWSIPASTSQAIMGAIIGIGMLHSGIPYLTTGSTPAKLLKVLICWVMTPIGGAVIAFVLYKILRKIVYHNFHKARLFDLALQAGFIISGCYGAYALGANNVANCTGVYVGRLLSAREAAVLGGLAIAFGSLTYSRKVMFTIGKKITTLDPFSAVVAVLAEAVTIHIYTFIGVPVSTSQAIVGAVVGIGLVHGGRTVQTRTLVEIMVGWVVTPVSAAIFAVLISKVF